MTASDVTARDEDEIMTQPGSEVGDHPDSSDGDRPAEHPNRTRWAPIRRIVDWFQRPWTTKRLVMFFGGTLPALLIPTIIMLVATQAFSGLLFANNTPTGGDFGAHVWGPDYLLNHVLKGGWYNGWSMDWYAGLPAYRFYMVVPALLILFFNIFLPYGIAMKIVSVLGLVTLPAACWAFGRLANFRYPMPEVFSFAGLVFVLDDSYQIFGGNLKSTMAGEFSFSIALSLAIVGLGLYARGLQTGKFKSLAAVVLSLAAVSHGLVLIFVAIAVLMLTIVWVDKTRIRYIAFVGVSLLLLSAWWVLPFIANHDYMTDMKYDPEPGGGSFTSFWQMYFPLPVGVDILMSVLTVAGLVIAMVRRHLNALALGCTVIVLAGLVWLLSFQQLPFLGLLWNPRLLPFLYLCRNLLMAYGAIELLTLFYNFISNRPARSFASYGPNTAFAAVFSLAALFGLSILYWVPLELPGVGTLAGITSVTNDKGEAKSAYYFGPFVANDTHARGGGPGWAAYNFKGYEGQSHWNEYRNVVNTMARVGNERGCGRAQWENSADNGQYGTTMALMLLPYWTNSCITSMEGLFFEASGTTPYHFLSTAAMSEKSSNPVRKLRYTNNDASIGVRELQSLGVKYTMLRTDAAKAQADQQASLTKVAESGPWAIYEVADADIVVPLSVQPVVANERGGDRRERLLELGTSWFQNPTDWDAMPASGGPPNWQRIDVRVDSSRTEPDGYGNNRVEVVVPAEPIKVIEQPKVQVSNVDLRNQSLSFDVSEVGTPVEVKVSYFPNWRVSGAQGPYRIGPNMMVVVPTETTVTLSYGRTWLDYLSVLATIGGIALCWWGYRRGDLSVAPVLFGATAERRREQVMQDASDALTSSYEAELALRRSRASEALFRPESVNGETDGRDGAPTDDKPDVVDDDDVDDDDVDDDERSPKSDDTAEETPTQDVSSETLPSESPEP